MYSAETALLKFKNDMIMNVRSVTALTLLDLSTALDNLDLCDISFINQLVNLSTWYGSALVWFVSYPPGREKKIKLLDCLASPAEVTCGAPQ